MNISGRGSGDAAGEHAFELGDVVLSVAERESLGDLPRGHLAESRMAPEPGALIVRQRRQAIRPVAQAGVDPGE
jgi:hypothetical protein